MTRIDRLRDLLEPDESLLVTKLVNVRYLTGFTGSNAAVLVGPERAVLVTDSRYILQAQAECHDVEVIIEPHILPTAAQFARGPLAVEGEHLSVADFHRLTSTLAQVRASAGLVESLRAVKDPDEVQWIRAACQIATAALEQMMSQIRIGMTELEVAQSLERRMVDLGAKGPAFPSIVAAGEHSAVPHHQPTTRPLQRGDLLKVDFGALVSGYHCDCTRTFTLGAASDWQLDLHSQVLQAQTAGLAAVHAGAKLCDIDSAARNAMSDDPHNFQHGLGHGVGLEIHEDPFLRATSDGRLAEDVVVTVEPGRYLPQCGGVRIEDTVLVTSDGYESLTVFPRDLTELA